MGMMYSRWWYHSHILFLLLGLLDLVLTVIILSVCLDSLRYSCEDIILFRDVNVRLRVTRI